MSDPRLIDPSRLAHLREAFSQDYGSIISDLLRHIDAMDSRAKAREYELTEPPLALHSGHPVLTGWARQTLAHAADHPAGQPPAADCDLSCPLEAAQQALVDAAQILPQDTDRCAERCIRARLLAPLRELAQPPELGAGGCRSAAALIAVIESLPPERSAAELVAESYVWACSRAMEGIADEQS